MEKNGYGSSSLCADSGSSSPDTGRNPFSGPGQDGTASAEGTWRCPPGAAETEECEFIDIPVPEVGQTIEVDIPVFFQYGTVKIYSISHIRDVDYTGHSRINAEGEYYNEKAEMDKLILQMKIEPNQKNRILYRIDAKPAYINYVGGHLLEDENDRR